MEFRPRTNRNWPGTIHSVSSVATINGLQIIIRQDSKVIPAKLERTAAKRCKWRRRERRGIVCRDSPSDWARIMIARRSTADRLPETVLVNWSEQLRDVQSVLDPADLRNQLMTVRDRLAGYRAAYRSSGDSRPDEVRTQLLMPLEQVRAWVQEELARQENAGSSVPLDRDPVPENYSDLVRKYYEKLGSAQ